MKAYGRNRKDFGCCPGHDKFPTDNRRSKHAQTLDTKIMHRANIFKLRRFKKMTVNDRIVLFLVERGLYPKQANEVMAIVRANEPTVKWNDNVESYPAMLLSALRETAKHEAIRWIDANMPLHFARTLLTS